MNSLETYHHVEGDGHFTGRWYLLTDDECKLIRVKKYGVWLNVNGITRAVRLSYA